MLVVLVRVKITAKTTFTFSRYDGIGRHRGLKIPDIFIVRVRLSLPAFVLSSFNSCESGCLTRIRDLIKNKYIFNFRKVGRF